MDFVCAYFAKEKKEKCNEIKDFGLKIFFYRTCGVKEVNLKQTTIDAGQKALNNNYEILWHHETNFSHAPFYYLLFSFSYRNFINSSKHYFNVFSKLQSLGTSISIVLYSIFLLYCNPVRYISCKITSLCHLVLVKY